MGPFTTPALARAARHAPPANPAFRFTRTSSHEPSTEGDQTMNKPVISASTIVAFVTPYISVASGLLASWLFVHFHWLGVFHLTNGSVAQTVAGSIVFAVTAGLSYAAAHFHWLPVVITKLEQR